MIKKNLYINRQKGILIAFEGISGCGKSEGVESLSRYLLSIGYKTKVIEWNSNKIIRKIVQKINSLNVLNSWIYSILQWISFLLDYILKITPLLRKEYILIADRYIYTGQTRDIVNGTGDRIGKKLYNSIRKPDLIFYYDIDVDVCFERIEKRGKVLFYPNRRLQGNGAPKEEKLDYLIKLHLEYLRIFQSPTLTNKTNIINVKGSDDLAKMQVRKSVQEYIGLKIGSTLNITKIVLTKL